MREGPRVSQSAGMALGLAGKAFAQEHKVGDDCRALIAEGIVGQADRAEEIGPRRKIVAGAAVRLVEGEAAGDEGQHTARRQDVNGLGEKIVVQGEAAGRVVVARCWRTARCQ